MFFTFFEAGKDVIEAIVQYNVRQGLYSVNIREEAEALREPMALAIHSMAREGLKEGYPVSSRLACAHRALANAHRHGMCSRKSSIVLGSKSSPSKGRYLVNLTPQLPLLLSTTSRTYAINSTRKVAQSSSPSSTPPLPPFKRLFSATREETITA